MYYEVKIPEPCSEDWSKMTPAEKGRFCDNCEKEVIDFTQFSQREIAMRVKNGEKICGRFRKDQLENPYFLPEENRLKNWKLVAGFGSLLALCNPSEIAAQKKLDVQNFQQKPSDSKGNNFSTRERIISGKVMAEDGHPLAIVLIVLEGTELITLTDIQGNFSMKIPDHNTGEQKLFIEHSGFEDKEVLLTEEKSEYIIRMRPSAEIVVKSVEYTVGGAVRCVAIKKVNRQTRKPRSRWFRRHR